VKNSAQKVIVYEVDERVLRDGRAQMQSPNVGMNIANKIMMVAIRHDGTRRMPDDFPDPTMKRPIEDNVNVDKGGKFGVVAVVMDGPDGEETGETFADEHGGDVDGEAGKCEEVGGVMTQAMAINSAKIQRRWR
jgi:hypothetical protein